MGALSIVTLLPRLWLSALMSSHTSSASSAATDISTWWASWRDFSSFGPDAIIGVGTGLIVAMIVLGTERRLAAPARRLGVNNAEGASVEKAQGNTLDAFLFGEGTAPMPYRHATSGWFVKAVRAAQ